MNLLHLATTDEGGAGMVCRKSNELFLKKGYNSLLVVKESSTFKENVVVFRKIPPEGSFGFHLNEWREKFIRLYRRFNPLVTNENHSFYGLFERRKHFSAKKILKRVPFKPDVILIYWVSEFINTKTMKDLVEMTGAKLLILMTDNSPLTGGCHYPWQCTGYQSDCSDCPGILTKSKRDIVRKNLLFKKKNLPAGAVLYAGSESDYRRALSSALFREKKVRRLFAPVDEKKFAPGNKTEAKSFFGIDPSKRVIFYGASEFKFLRKGGRYFLEALNMLKRKSDEDANDNLAGSFIILIAGKDWQQYFSDVDFPIKDVGFLNEDGLVKAFQAADFFVSPSIEDSGPAMVIQSIMCGTPVLAFNTGMAMDMVHTGKTGYLAKLCDVEDLSEGLRFMLSLSCEELQEMSVNCRNMGMKEYTLDVFAGRLIDAFH